MADETMADQERARRRAPGWVVRCLKCGYTQPWGRYGVRLWGWSWKKCTLGRCPRCKRIGCHMIEKRKDDRKQGTTDG
jgi:hypothetical protein